jgi:hypothetical protein
VRSDILAMRSCASLGTWRNGTEGLVVSKISFASSEDFVMAVQDVLFLIFEVPERNVGKAAEACLILRSASRENFHFCQSDRIDASQSLVHSVPERTASTSGRLARSI